MLRLQANRAQDALAIDHAVGWPESDLPLRRTPTAVIDREWIVQRRALRDVVHLVASARSIVDAEDDEAFRSEFLHHLDVLWKRRAAGAAPRCPEVNDDDLAFERVDVATVSIQLLQSGSEFGCLFANDGPSAFAALHLQFGRGLSRHGAMRGARFPHAPEPLLRKLIRRSGHRGIDGDGCSERGRAWGRKSSTEQSEGKRGE